MFRYFVLGVRAVPIIVLRGIKYFVIGLISSLTVFPKYLIIGIGAVMRPEKTRNIRIRNKPLVPLMVMSLSLIIYFSGVFLFSRWAVQKLKMDYLYTDIMANTEVIEENGENSGMNGVNAPNEGSEENVGDNGNVYYPNDYWDYINVPFIDVDFNSLRGKNSETVAWLKVNGTYVNYPVVRHSDNGYYLNHDFGGRYNPNGWIYSDYRSNYNSYGYNSIIYGHNLNNRTLFGSLVWVLNSNWYTNSNNYIIKLSTPSNNTNWKVFSVYSTQNDAYYLKTMFNSSEEFGGFVNELKNRSIFDFGTVVSGDDRILTLSTCDDTGTKRVVVHAKMVNISYK